MQSIRRHWRAALGLSAAIAILSILAVTLWPNPSAPAQRADHTTTVEHKPDTSSPERHEEPKGEPQGSNIDESAGAPLLSSLTDLSTVPDKDSKVAKAAEPCNVIADAEIRKIFKNREVTFYHDDPAKRPVISNNPQLIRSCDYTGVMLDIYGNRANMTFTVFTELDNAKHEGWKLITAGMSADDYVDKSVFTDGFNYTALAGQVIVRVMPTSTQPGLTSGDVESLIKFAQARLS